VSALSPHGTAGSLAYSQMTFLPAIQVASLAGTAGIVFTLALFAALVATALHCRTEPPHAWAVYGVPSLVVIAVLGYGVARLAQGEDAGAFPIGLAASDVASPAPGAAANPGDRSWDAYLAGVPNLTAAGAKIIVWPEKIAPLDRAGGERVRALLGGAARDGRIYLLAGVTVIGTDHRENRAWLFAPSGELIADYAKQHLVPGFEARFKPGNEDVVRSIGAARFGIAICKDMDFAPLGRAYARLGVNAMLVPSWDFDVDAWSHASMAVLRGVEGGFSVIRPARHGLLTVSDRYGRIVNRMASAEAPLVAFEAMAPLGPGAATPYARLGDWFGWLCAGYAAVAALGLAVGRREDHARGGKAAPRP